MNTTWDIFKPFVVARNLSIQWIDLNDTYWLKAFDGPFQLECVLDKQADPDSTLDFETSFKSKGNTILSSPAPFAAKTLGSKKLYKRIQGISVAIVRGSNDILFTIPFPWVKITGLDVIGSENLDTVSMYVLDTVTGTYSTVPNYMLNQFGFNVNVSKDTYSYHSEFDADLFQNMQIKITYNSVSDKTIGINFILNEVK